MSHTIQVTIQNQMGKDQELKYKAHWFDSGRLKDDSNFPSTIAPGDSGSFNVQNKDGSLDGVSGYVEYGFLSNAGSRCQSSVAVAFSNPESGENKIGMGFGGGREVWDNMESHYSNDWHDWKEKNTCGDWNTLGVKNTSGDHNSAEAKIGW